MSISKVAQALLRFLPAFIQTKPPLCREQWRAIRSMEECRTASLGWHVHGCEDCDKEHYTFNSCNHKSCPQCGRGATYEWVQREDSRRLPVPYFMVTFTVPSELRSLFFGPTAKQAFDWLFSSAAATLSEVLGQAKWLGAEKNGCTMVLHTWNQQMLVHPHVHCIVPGAGLDKEGKYVEVRRPQFLVPAAALKKAFRHHFGAAMKEASTQCDPAVWRQKWAVNVKPFGDGANAIKYLGAYVSRSVIGDSRIVSMTQSHVTFKWKDRAQGNIERHSTVEGVEFVRRYLRHVLPKGLKAVRYYGFRHPAAKKQREEVTRLCLESKHAKQETPCSVSSEAVFPTPKAVGEILAGSVLVGAGAGSASGAASFSSPLGVVEVAALATAATAATAAPSPPSKAEWVIECPCCQKPMTYLGQVNPRRRRRPKAALTAPAAPVTPDVPEFRAVTASSPQIPELILSG